ncbi:hypothetical protein GCM10010469_70450 [Streptomyces labedae]|uniref:Uncharacterized protein n=1 Tax=Streptomyces labedae TaxID=285569 RepID=A0ABP6RCU1_9ACTN
MLASTVQFSNNDQPPITPGTNPECTGAGTEGDHTAVPSDTQQRARHSQLPRSAFHAPKGQY